jgi:hypothetical protein
MSPGMKARTAIMRPCKKRPPGHIKANFRRKSGRTQSPSVSDVSVKNLRLGHLTESGAIPLTLEALLLLAEPEAETLQKLVELPEYGSDYARPEY